jgi:subtilisin
MKTSTTPKPSRPPKTKRSPKRPARAQPAALSAETPIEPGTTGRLLVLMREGKASDNLRRLKNTAGLKVADASDFTENRVDVAGLGGADGILLDELGVAIIGGSLDEHRALLTAAADEGNPAFRAAEPERFVYATETEWATSLSSIREPNAGNIDYLRGCRDTMRSSLQLLDRFLGDPEELPRVGTAQAGMSEEREFTWGLEITGVAKSRFSGEGIRVAVLDTGIDLNHPDFANRVAGFESFIENEHVQDGRGHGSHCAGTACGPERPASLPRYGVATRAQLYVAKVLGDSGRGSDGTLLAGLRWAVRQGCRVVSMSLEKGVLANEPFSPIFEEVAKIALERGAVIIAAAGNKSQRPFALRPVSHPANCPSILAVAALDPTLGIATFSNAGLQENGGKVDLAGPGVNVLSAWPLPRKYHRIHGTSMATPHVAGIAALWAEAREATGRELLELLRSNARALELSSSDVGAGLVQAP